MDKEVGPEAQRRLAWHAESCIARLLEPTLAALSPAELRAVEYAAFLTPDNVALPSRAVRCNRNTVSRARRRTRRPSHTQR